MAQGGNSQNTGGGSPTYVSITAGHYTPESMAKTITETLKKNNIDITGDTRTSLGVMNILNPKNKYTFTLSENLIKVFGLLVRRLDVKGMPYTKITYQTAQPHVLREVLTSDYDVNSLTISIQDEKGNLFDFNGMPLEFEIEIN